MKDKIKQKLEDHNLTINDLTQQELEMLKEEVKAEEKGEIVLDGVLSFIPPYREEDKID